MKRIVALLLALLILSGCGAAPEPAPEPEPEVKTEAPKQPAPAPEPEPEKPEQREEPEQPEQPAAEEPIEEEPAAEVPLEWETSHLDGMVEDAVAFDLEILQVSGIDGAETINQYYLDLAAYLENHTRDTVYLEVMEMHTMANVYGVVSSVSWEEPCLVVEYLYRVEYLNDKETGEFSRVDRFDPATGELLPEE